MIGPVGQEPVQFARTVEENISYGLSDVSMEAVEQAATKANAHEFISCLPTGYQTSAGSLTAGDYPGPVPRGLLYTKGRTRPYRCCANHEAA
ncbi:hypothetical protein NQZ68_041973 [Dissostichus eleginoides]|nr:hypothetical protein NQZ68_041973 [Dissostichus eleginoides]